MLTTLLSGHPVLPPTPLAALRASLTPHAVTHPAHSHFLLPSTLPPFHTEPDWGYAADSK